MKVTLHRDSLDPTPNAPGAYALLLANGDGSNGIEATVVPGALAPNITAFPDPPLWTNLYDLAHFSIIEPGETFALDVFTSYATLGTTLAVNLYGLWGYAQYSATFDTPKETLPRFDMWPRWVDDDPGKLWYQSTEIDPVSSVLSVQLRIFDGDAGTQWNQTYTEADGWLDTNPDPTHPLDITPDVDYIVRTIPREFPAAPYYLKILANPAAISNCEADITLQYVPLATPDGYMYLNVWASNAPLPRGPIVPPALQPAIYPRTRLRYYDRPRQPLKLAT